jgi:hypothetical protein
VVRGVLAISSRGILTEYFWVIASVIYVGGMFPLYLYYQSDPLGRFGPGTSLDIISTAGAFLLFIQFFVAAWFAPSRKRRADEVEEEKMASA